MCVFSQLTFGQTIEILLYPECVLLSLLRPRLTADMDETKQKAHDYNDESLIDNAKKYSQRLALTKPPLTQPSRREVCILNFGNNNCFASAQPFARAYRSFPTPENRAVLYLFNCPSPWEGTLKRTCDAYPGSDLGTMFS